MAYEWDRVQTRRLPVYLLLDCSSSMAGVKIEQVNTGVQMLYQELMADPRSADTVYISIIPFASSAYQMDLVPIAQFTPPQLKANGQRALGSALSLLNQSLDSDLIINQPGKKGDYKPLVFILTDGPPTDIWQVEAQRLKSRAHSELASIIALAIGDNVPITLLKQLTDNVLKVENVTGDNLRAFFQWVSQPVQTASKPFPHIFVSHSHRDDAFTSRLVADLRRAGAEVWVDMTGMDPGNFMQRISQALDTHEWMVLVLTPAAIGSQYVQEEVFTALHRVKQGRMHGVIPVLAAPCTSGTVPSLWDALHRYDATRDYDAALQGVLRAMGLR
ncbi:MAG TPA: TIR domain-containing protein [Ktedonobacterales bacterium]|nr:TIR domain-containing protein [Ktedonobacterales bacterium]